MAENPKKDERKLTAYERWELPNLADGQDKPIFEKGILLKTEATVTSEEVDQSTLVYEPLTASQLEEIRSAAYEEGFAQGTEEGRKEGLEKGYEEGLEKGNAEGFETGHKQGYDEGHAEALTLAEEKLAQIEAQLELMQAELIAPITNIRSEIDELIFATVSRLVENISLIQLTQTAKDDLSKQLRMILDSVEDVEGKIRIRLNPEDYENLKEFGVLDRTGLHIELDDSLQQGGFFIDSKEFFVDGSIETRLQSVMDELKELHNQIRAEDDVS